MARTYNAQPPVKPIGKILYHQWLRGYWDRDNPKWKGKEPPEPSYDKVCECKGFSDDRPFSVFQHKDPKDRHPFKVVFHWYNERPKYFKVKRAGEDRNEVDSDTRHMMDVLEEHQTKSAAQKAMRRYAAEAFAKVNNAPKGEGDGCHNVWLDPETTIEHPLKVGDLVEYTSCPGIVWRIEGERRANDSWYLQVEPVFSFLVNNGTNKRKELFPRDVYNYVRPIDLVKLGAAYMQLGNVLKDEAKRRSE